MLIQKKNGNKSQTGAVVDSFIVTPESVVSAVVVSTGAKQKMEK